MSGAAHVVVAPDKFKGSLTAPEVAEHIGRGLHRALPALDVRLAPVADGGEGTVDALAAAGGYALVPATVTGPTGEPVRARYATRGRTAVVELAEASGLRRLPGGRTDPMRASSRGTGELLRAALEAGCDRIVVGLGGSACTDGGAGMLQALGARLLDRHGHELRPGGAALQGLQTVDLDGLDPRLHAADVVLATDVDNPLLGPHGAAAVYAPQKGATAAEVEELEVALHRWAEALRRATGRDVSDTPGAGAAGGVGSAGLAVLGAGVRPGIDLVLELIGFAGLLPGARLVITGEGSLDRQSLRGKAPVGVAAAAGRGGVPAIAVAGACSLTPADVAATGLQAAYALTSIEPDREVCIAEAGRLLQELVAGTVAPRWLTGPVRARHGG